MRETTTRRRVVADKREALLRAALALFARDGFHNVSTAAISRAAGVATGTLYVYFQTKEDLINTLYRRSSQIWPGQRATVSMTSRLR